MMRGRVWPAQIPRPSRQQYQFPPTAESWCSISPSTPPVPTPLGPSPFASARPPPARVPESRAAPALGGWRLMDLQELAKIPPYHGCARHEKRPAFFRRVEKTGPATARAGTLAPLLPAPPFYGTRGGYFAIYWWEVRGPGLGNRRGKTGVSQGRIPPSPLPPSSLQYLLGTSGALDSVLGAGPR